MAGNTGTSVQSNETFYTGVVPIVVGVLNPVNSPQTVWDCGVGMNYAQMTTNQITGSPVSFTIVLEGTYDGTNWTVLATTTNVAGESQFSSSANMFTNLRARCTAVSGGTNPTINIAVTASQTPFTNVAGGTSGNTAIVEIMSGNSASLATVDGNNGLRVSDGSTTGVTTLNAATSTATGAVVDNGSASQSHCFQVVTSGTITAGAITFLGSVDNTTFIPIAAEAILGSTGSPTISNGVLSMTAATTALVGIGSNNTALRFLRADVTTNITGGGSATVKIMTF